MYLWSSTVAHRLDDGRASSDDARRMPCVVDGTVQCSPSSCSDVEQPGAFDSRSKSRCFAQGPCCMSYGLPEAVDHVSTPARLRTLMLRFSGACCSRSCARPRYASAQVACAARAAAHPHGARTLTQRAGSRGASVARAARAAGPGIPSTTFLPRLVTGSRSFPYFYLAHNQTPFDLHSTRFACA
jgi:hypothetical protein